MRPELLVPRDLAPAIIVDMLALVGVKAPETAVSRWTGLELALAADWATREHYHASGGLTRRRDKPSFVAQAEAAGTHLGKRVKARLGTDQVVTGILLGYGQDGCFEIQHDDGTVHYCWPLLEIAEAPAPQAR